MKYFILLLLLPVFVMGDPIRIDLSKDTGRSDTAKPGWHEWQVADGPSVTRKFDGVQVTLRTPKDDKQGLRGIWNKKGLADGAAMATDGVSAQGNGGKSELNLVIKGLKPGKHSLVTYHNFVNDDKMDKIILTQEADESGKSVVPTRRVKNDNEAASHYTEFEVSDNKPVTFRIKNAKEGVSPYVILNGIEINGSNPKTRALNPKPRTGDIHVDGEDGQIKLEFDPAESSVDNMLFFASGYDKEAVEKKVRDAHKYGDSYTDTFASDAYYMDVDKNDSLKHYAWRVDSIDSNGKITKGNVWHFRVRHLAFPGAEGYGRFAIGGRGGRVIKVTNLNDSGPGSLRAAVEAKGPRTVIFDVSGRIVLEDTLVARDPFITIAGHTAPGKGICISNYNFGAFGTHDVIIRHMRVRPGDTSGDTLDGMGMASSNHVIFDHCSISWTHDESFSSRGAENITLQRTLISEALNIAGHESYEEGTQHGFAASISGDIGSFHHNLLAHCAGRNWSLAGGLDQAARHAGRLDIRNNVVYNWGYRTTDGGAKEVNFVNNYYKPGPATTVFHVLKPERKNVPLYGPQVYYVKGNVMEGHYGADERYAGVEEEGDESMEEYLVEDPLFPPHVETQSAKEAYDNVLADVGATIPVMDDHDKRIIRETRNGTTTYKGSVSGFPGLPDSQEDVGGWEDYPEVQRPKSWDSDDDGMADKWEKANGLDPDDPEDGKIDSNGNGYTNLEEYLHWLADGNKVEEL